MLSTYLNRGWSLQLLPVLMVLLVAPYKIEAQDPCSGNPCGANTQCLPRGNRPVCVCLPGYWGDPLTYCKRGECAVTADCSGNSVCRDYRCVDVCSGQCGQNAQCTPRSHVPTCTCPPGYTGDPLSYCRPFNPQELCSPSPCGRNTRCEVINEVPTCSCLPGYVGAPLTGCNHECDSDYDCPSNSKCANFKCTQLCSQSTCAPTARCDASGHRAVCTCPPGTFGDPYSSCNLECESHLDCSSGRSACSAGRCIDPCAGGVCGVGANCRVKERTTPVCSCPRDMTGDPFVACRPFDQNDLCIPNPCGTHAECTPGHDRTGKERPVCTCPPGYTGNALVACHRGECTTDSDCRHDQTCSGYSCQAACQDQCGVGASCQARNHVAVCTCPPGTTGQPLARCNPIPRPVAASLREGRVYYNKK